MRTWVRLAAAALLASSVAPSSVFAQAPAPRTVRIDQTVHRTVNGCAYTSTIRGSYVVTGAAVEGVTPVRDAVIDVDVRLACRGEAPTASLRQIYFAATGEERLLEHLAQVARVEHAAARGATCALEPAFARDGATLSVAEVRVQCSGAAPAEATASAARAPTHPRGGGPRR